MMMEDKNLEGVGKERLETPSLIMLSYAHPQINVTIVGQTRIHSRRHA